MENELLLEFFTLKTMMTFCVYRLTDLFGFTCLRGHYQRNIHDFRFPISDLQFQDTHKKYSRIRHWLRNRGEFPN